MVSGQDTRLAENVALLHYLTAFPSPPSTNPLPPLANSQGPARILSFERERSLTSGLAFLAGTSDNPNHIVAVCVEENPRKDGLSVVLAINKARPTDAEDVLDTTKRGLQGVFDILGEVRYDSDRPELEFRVLQAVISLSRKRILQRIGSGRIGYSGRPTTHLGKILKMVTAIVVKRSQQGSLMPPQPTMAQLFIGASNVLEARLSELENCSASDIGHKLQQIIAEASKLSKTTHLPDLLRNVPARELDPNLADALTRRLGKLGRYHSFTRYLYQTAKNTKLFRNAAVKSVTLPPDCFVKAQSGPPQCNLEDCLGRCQQTKDSKKQLYLKLGVESTQVNDELSAATRKSASGSKIHAEIQILAHYEMNPTRPSPRVISSSKDACYLCQELIKLHAKYHTPRSHGRLYRGWKTPNLAIFTPLQKRLNKALEARIAIACRQILTSGQKLAVDQPIESTIFELSTSMSTIPSLPSGRDSLVDLIEPFSCEDVTVPACHEAMMEDTVGISSPKGSAEAVIPERSKGKRTDSGYCSLPAPGTLDDSSDQHHILPLGSPEIAEPLQLSPVTGARPLVSDKACAKDNSSSVEIGTVQRGETPGDLRIPVSNGGPNPDGLANQDNVTHSLKEGEGRITTYGDGFDIPASIGNSPTRRSAFILRKGVVVQCRPTDYTSFRAGPLRIFPELATNITLGKRTTDCRLRLEWLENVHEGTPVTDVRTLSEVTGTDTSDRFFLRHGDTVLKIEIIRS